MFSQIITCGLLGLEGYRILVETDLSNGLPIFDIVGLADTAVKEARERVRAAIRNSGHQFPAKRLIINLSPADTKKEGAGFDLPIAIGILTSMGILPERPGDDHAFFGELALDGRLRMVNGILSKAIAARDAGCRTLILPAGNAGEASLVSDLRVLPAESLSDVCRHLTGECCLEPLEIPIRNFFESDKMSVRDALHGCLSEDFKDVRGQEAAKRAIEVAAAGGHHLFMSGSAGAGKTMLARRTSGILPEPDMAEALQITRIHSVAGLLSGTGGLVTERPFRSPHHTISNTGLIGGGRIPRPGEISLAHGGVLFLDELPEFNRAALDSLRQPLEEGRVVLARIQATITYPSRFMLVAAANPCKCGHYGEPGAICTCPPRDAEHYHARLSGPLMDRMDIRIHIPSLTYEALNRKESPEGTEAIRERVEAARRLQLVRFKGSGSFCNAQLSGASMRQWCGLDGECAHLMERAFRQLSLSMRGHDRILRVARTIADLDASDEIRRPHLAEAIQYRSTPFHSIRGGENGGGEYDGGVLSGGEYGGGVQSRGEYDGGVHDASGL